MRARIDKTGEENPNALIDAAYSDQYFTVLERRFRLETGNAETRRELRNIGVRYLTSRRSEDNRKMRKELRVDNAYLAKQTNKYLQILRNAPHDDITFGLYMTALRLDEGMPAAVFPDLSAHDQRHSGEPYFLELMRLLELLEKSALEQANHFRERPGPKINLGLEYLVRHVADLFLVSLKRPFTVDHHKPVAASEAFDFVSTLVEPLDDVSATEITTAIRAEQGVRRKLSTEAGKRNTPKAKAHKSTN